MKQVDNGGYYACSSKCAMDKNRNTMKERYVGGYRNKDIIEKRKQTTLERYGVDNISKTNMFKEKYEATMLERYGVTNGFQSEEIKNKSKQTNLEKYGCEYVTQSEDHKIKYLYGNKNPSYKHGETYNRSIWMNSESRTFKRKIFAEKGRTCICCSQEKKEMQIHHINSRNTHPHLIYNKYNVVIMCKDCHQKFHSTYGYGNNNTLQFIEFLNNMSE